MTSQNQKLLRNFCIIAHIDHGKSTLADRIIQHTGGLSSREMVGTQVLDTLELEQERGITIKAQSVSLEYKAKDGQTYQLNLIDTPGHVDFSYEVSRSLAACEGAILLVDAAQGVQAQTMANVYLALEQDLEIVSSLNKLDLPNADPEGVKEELKEMIGLSGALHISAKTGLGVPELLEEVVKTIPAPKGDSQAPLKALIYDAWFDSYLGVMVMLRVKEGEVKKGDLVRFMASGKEYEVVQLGKFTPHSKEVEKLSAGEVGFMSASIKTIHDAQVGDTLTLQKNPSKEALPGYTPAKPMVFCGLYPSNGEAFERLRGGLEKLSLNDAALSYEPETSAALGMGFRCRFLGLLHMEIVQQRLERELGLGLITTSPTVVYQVYLKTGESISVENPNHLPDPTKIDRIEEPYVRGRIMVPKEYVGNIMKLALQRRGEQREMLYSSEKRVTMEYDFPLNEIIFDFYDKLKSLTRGYGSFDYELIGFRPGKLVKLDALLNGDPVDALSLIVPQEKTQERGRHLVTKLKAFIPRQMFEVAIQAAVGSKIIARETVSAMRKNVTAKCYGGDITRKRKLLEKQKEGKKRMRQVGSVEIPQEAFMAIVAADDN